MIRRLFFMLILSSLMTGVVFADTYAEKVKKVDAEGKTISIVIDQKEKTFSIDAKAQFLSQVRAGKRLNVTPIKDGLNAIKPGDDVVLTTELKAGEEVVTKVVRSLAGTTPKKTPDPKKQ